MSRVNILKQLKVDGRWKLVSIPRDRDGRYNWKALPDGRYFIEWWEHGKRKRRAAGATAAEAQEAARRRKHILEGRALGVEGYGAAEDDAGLRTPLHVSVKRYLDVVEGLKKPNTLRKYRAVLNPLPGILLRPHDAQKHLAGRPEPVHDLSEAEAPAQ